MQKKHINIAFATDSNYIIPATVAILSFLENNKESTVSLYLLGIEEELKEVDINRVKVLTESYNAKFRPLVIGPEYFHNMPRLRHGLSAYLRIFLPQLLSDIDKILYIDVDTIIEGSLQPLYDINMDDFELGAVADVMPMFTPLYLENIGFKKNRHYFCSGILIMNLKKLRERGIIQKSAEYLSIYRDRIKYSDQDILNCVCNNVKELPPKYNSIQCYFIDGKSCLKLWDKDSINEAKQNPVIIHYLSPSKPWHYLNVHPLKKRWYFYLSKTEYKNYVPNDKSLKNFFYLQYKKIRQKASIIYHRAV